MTPRKSTAFKFPPECTIDIILAALLPVSVTRLTSFYIVSCTRENMLLYKVNDYQLTSS